MMPQSLASLASQAWFKFQTKRKLKSPRLNRPGIKRYNYTSDTSDTDDSDHDEPTPLTNEELASFERFMAKRKLERRQEVNRIQKIVQDEFPDVDERITSQFSKRVMQKHWPDKKSSEYIKTAFEQKDERYYGDQHASDYESDDDFR